MTVEQNKIKTCLQKKLKKNTSQYKDMTDSSESSSKQNHAYFPSQLLKVHDRYSCEAFNDKADCMIIIEVQRLSADNIIGIGRLSASLPIIGIGH